MENKETAIKEVKGRNLKWYWTLIESIGDNVVDTTRLSELMTAADKANAYGNDYAGKKKSLLRESLQKILNGRLEIVEDSSVKSRGQSKGFLVSINLNPGETLTSIQGEVKNTFDKLSRNPYKGAEDRKSQTKPKTKKEETTTAETPSLVTTTPTPRELSGRTLLRDTPRKDTRLAEVLYLWKLLANINREGTNVLKFPHPSLYGDKPLTVQEVLQWIKSLQKVGIKINYDLSGAIRRERMKILNLQDVLQALVRYGKRNGMNINPAEAGIVSVSPLDPAAFKYANQEPLSEQERKMAWIICGILEEFSPKPIDAFALGKYSHERFGVQIPKPILEQTAKKIPEIFYNYNSGLVSFNRETTPTDNPDERWEQIRQKYSPENVEKEVLARVSMTLSEIQYFFPKTEVVSVIGPSEAIYRIRYTASERDKLRLVSLYLGFRGTDMFLDSTLEESLKKEVLPNVLRVLEDGNPLLRMEAW